MVATVGNFATELPISQEATFLLSRELGTREMLYAMARGENKSYEAGEIWAYVDELRSAARFPSEGQFAIAAGFLPSTLSDWKHGKHVMSSLNLVRLIRAAAARRATAPFEAGEAVEPLMALHHRLAALEAQAERGRAAFLESLGSIDARLSRIEGWQEPPDERDSEAHH